MQTCIEPRNTSLEILEKFRLNINDTFYVTILIT